jgi:hypothetical protein
MRPYPRLTLGASPTLLFRAFLPAPACLLLCHSSCSGGAAFAMRSRRKPCTPSLCTLAAATLLHSILLHIAAVFLHACWLQRGLQPQL